METRRVRCASCETRFDIEVNWDRFYCPECGAILGRQEEKTAPTRLVRSRQERPREGPSSWMRVLAAVAFFFGAMSFVGGLVAGSVFGPIFGILFMGASIRAWKGEPQWRSRRKR